MYEKCKYIALWWVRNDDDDDDDEDDEGTPQDDSLFQYMNGVIKNMKEKDRLQERERRRERYLSRKGLAHFASPATSGTKSRTTEERNQDDQIRQSQQRSSYLRKIMTKK